MELGLGRFGDRRLQKGGCFFTVGWLRSVGRVFRFCGSAAAVVGRCGSPAFFAIRR